MSVTVENIPLPKKSCDDLPDLPIYRLSVEQYRAMARAGILEEDAPVELLEGLLVQKMTKRPPHITATRLLVQMLTALLPAGWMVDSQNPIAASDSEPEPDLVVIRGAPLDYRDRLAAPDEVALVVEVADSSLRKDRGAKKRLYARAGYAIYWIANLVDRQIEVYTEPTGVARKTTYRRRRNYRASEAVPVLLNGVEIGRIPVESLLP